MSERNGMRELSFEMMEQVCGAGVKVPVFAGAKMLGGGSGSPHRQPVDPPPSLGSGYNGDSFDTDPQSGGYMGDGNSYPPF